MIDSTTPRRLLALLSAPFVLIVYLNIEKLAEGYGWDVLLLGAWVSYSPALYEQLTKQWLSFTAVAIVSFTLGVWSDSLLRSRRQQISLVRTGGAASELAERAEKLSRKLYDLLGQFPSRPPTHPNFKQQDNHDTDGWWRQNHEQRERVVTKFLEQHASEAWTIIEQAKNYIRLEELEIYRLSHVSSDYDVSEMARTMALIAARLHLVLSGEIPIVNKSETN